MWYYTFQNLSFQCLLINLELTFLISALLVLYVPMTAVGYFELGEMARWVTLVAMIVILANVTN